MIEALGICSAIAFIAFVQDNTAAKWGAFAMSVMLLAASVGLYVWERGAL